MDETAESSAPAPTIFNRRMLLGAMVGLAIGALATIAFVTGAHQLAESFANISQSITPAPSSLEFISAQATAPSYFPPEQVGFGTLGAQWYAAFLAIPAVLGGLLGGMRGYNKMAEENKTRGISEKREQENGLGFGVESPQPVIAVAPAYKNSVSIDEMKALNERLKQGGSVDASFAAKLEQAALSASQELTAAKH